MKFQVNRRALIAKRGKEEDIGASIFVVLIMGFIHGRVNDNLGGMKPIIRQ